MHAKAQRLSVKGCDLGLQIWQEVRSACECLCSALSHVHYLSGLTWNIHHGSFGTCPLRVILLLAVALIWQTHTSHHTLPS